MNKSQILNIYQHFLVGSISKPARAMKANTSVSVCSLYHKSWTKNWLYQSEYLMRHLVSMLDLGLASGGVLVSWTAECGTQMLVLLSNWLKIHTWSGLICTYEMVSDQSQESPTFSIQSHLCLLLSFTPCITPTLSPYRILTLTRSWAASLTSTINHIIHLLIIDRSNIQEAEWWLFHDVDRPPDVEDANMAIIEEPLSCSLATQKWLDPPDSGFLDKVPMYVVSRRIPTALSPLWSGRKTMTLVVLQYTGTGC